MISRFSAFLLKQKRIAFLLLLFLVVFGSYTISNIKRQGFPEVDINIVLIQTLYPNASSSQIEETVLPLIEEQLQLLDSVEEFETIAQDSFAVAVVTLDVSSDIDKSYSEISDKISSITFPDGVEKPVVEKITADELGSFVVSVSGYETDWDLYNAGKDKQKELLALDDVARVTPLNPLIPKLTIKTSSDDMLAAGLTQEDIIGAIQGNNFKIPLGSIVQDGEKIQIAFSQEISSIEELNELMVAPGIELKDIAEIELTLENGDKYNRVGINNGDGVQVERTLLYSIGLANDADIIEVEKDLLLLENQNIVYSQAESTRLQIDEITFSLLGQFIEGIGPFGVIGFGFGGLGLVVLTMLIFMNFRVAVMAALAIPFSLFTAIGYLYFQGVELNTLVLFALVLVIGLVVDPTIVFLESMQRLLDKGYSNFDAVKKTFETVGSGIFLAVMTNIIVFVPFGLVSGFFGEIIQYIPMTVVPAMIASLFVPVFIYVPLSQFLMKKHKKAAEKKDWLIARKFESMLLWLLKKGKARLAFRITVLCLLLSSPILLGSFLFGTGIVEPVQFSSSEDSDYILISGDIPNEWTFEKSVYEAVVPMQDIIADYEEVRNFFYFTQQGNGFSVMLTLLPTKERSDAGMRIADDISKSMNTRFEKIDSPAVIQAITSSEGPPTMGYPVKVRIFDEDTETLAMISRDIRLYLSEQDGVDVTGDTLGEKTSGGTITYGMQKGARLPAFAASGLIRGKIAEQKVSNMVFDGIEYEVAIAPGETVEDISFIDDINLPVVIDEKHTILVPLTDSIEEKASSESTSIHRLNGKRFVEAYATLKEGESAGPIQADLEEYVENRLIDWEIDAEAISYQGTVDSMNKSFQDLFITLGIAIFLIYLLLVGFFKSFAHPFIILMAIPLGLIGVFLAVALTTGQLGFLELLGVITMAGIVVNVTILLIDYANQLRKEGMSASAAIAKSVRVRWRPIFLTQMTAFGSLIPLVFMSPFWKGLAASVIMGIASSAFLSFFVAPIMYSLHADMSDWFSKNRDVFSSFGRNLLKWKK